MTPKKLVVVVRDMLDAHKVPSLYIPSEDVGGTEIINVPLRHGLVTILVDADQVETYMSDSVAIGTYDGLPKALKEIKRLGARSQKAREANRDILAWREDIRIYAERLLEAIDENSIEKMGSALNLIETRLHDIVRCIEQQEPLGEEDKTKLRTLHAKYRNADWDPVKGLIAKLDLKNPTKRDMSLMEAIDLLMR